MFFTPCLSPISGMYMLFGVQKPEVPHALLIRAAHEADPQQRGGGEGRL